MQSQRITNSQMSASSQRSSLSGATHGRAGNYPEKSRSEGGWIPSSFSQSQYLQIDLRKEMKITAVETQGADGPNYWVVSYKVQFSRDGRSWSTSSQVCYVKGILLCNERSLANFDVYWGLYKFKCL